MRVRLQDSNVYLDLDMHPHDFIQGLDDNTKQDFQRWVDERGLKCDGCGKSLKGKAWVCTLHRPKSALDEERWAVFFMCYDTREKCGAKWLAKRPE